jgi:hypothetical protein
MVKPNLTLMSDSGENSIYAARCPFHPMPPPVVLSIYPFLLFLERSEAM